MENEKTSIETGLTACARRVPFALVLLDNVPTGLLYFLGAVIFFQTGFLPGTAFTLYAVSSLFWFWGRICTHCRHYATQGCPCGYGVISARLFPRKTGGNFRKIFKTNIPYLFPLWFLPPAAGLYLLLTSYSTLLLIELIAFSVIGFAVIPLISKMIGCKNCDTRAECPWMKK